MRRSILGVPVDDLHPVELAELIRRMSRSSRHQIVTVNPEIIMEARANPALCDVIHHADISLPDGFGVILAGRYLGQPINHRFTGVQLMLDLAQSAAKSGRSIYLLGGLRGVAQTAAAELRKKYPDLKIAGAETELRWWGWRLDDRTLRQKINRAKPDYLFVAFGAPKQELWIARNLPRLPNVKIAVGVGGTFDMLARRHLRAVKPIRQLGLEWLWRLMIQPWRWSRIVTATIRFPLEVYREKRTERRPGRQNGGGP